MKREIKFRGKDCKTGKWKYGDLHNATYDGMEAPVIITNRDLTFDEEVDKLENVALVFGYEEVAICDPATVGQYTGLKDSKGTPMYEGDVVRNGDKGFLYVIEWHDCGLCGKQIGSSSYIGLTVWRERLVVVGNRFDNPELLEVKKPEPIAKNGLLPHEFRIRALYDNGCMSKKGHVYIAERVKVGKEDFVRIWSESYLDEAGRRRYGYYINASPSLLGNGAGWANYEIVEEYQK